MDLRPSENRYFSNTALGISGVYLIISVIWIAFSGKVAVILSSSTAMPLERIELFKGIGFVLVTSILLYVLIQNSVNRLRINEYRIRRLNRVYAILHNINSAILRINNEQILLDEVCRIAVEHGLYDAVAVRLIDADVHEVKLVAVAGPKKSIAENMPISLDEYNVANHGPTGIALREGRQRVTNKLSEDSGSEAYFHVAKEYGIRSVAAFPLMIDTNLAGAVTFYSGYMDVFDGDEILLLEELAADTSLGLKYIKKDQELAYYSFYDMVTGLPNRDLALDRIKQAVSGYGYRSRRLTAVINISLENYRRISGTHGNAAADNVLRDIADHLSRQVRQGDTVARLDAHDFGVILTDVSSVTDITLVLEKLMASLPLSIPYRKDEILPFYRAGIAVHPYDGDVPGEIVRRAGIALTEARKIQEPYRYFSKDLEDKTTREYSLEKGLRDAIRNNELELYYQPIVSLSDRKVIGFEALSRWYNSSLGQVSPTEFIPLAENTGQILSLSSWSARRAVMQLKSWLDNGAGNLYVSINISPYVLRSRGMANRFLEMLAESGMESLSRRIILEITESVMIEDYDTVMPELEILKSSGIRLYVDDFGTGYSSLSYLRKFPVDAVKIDREFINGIADDDSNLALVSGIIGMAGGTGLHVIAEGVETEAQYEILKELGCDMAQGYLFSRPLPPDEIFPG